MSCSVGSLILWVALVTGRIARWLPYRGRGAWADGMGQRMSAARYDGELPVGLHAVGRFGSNLCVRPDLLFATDVDPGRGFTQRRLAPTALGRLGLRDATPVLLRALENEALDYEGRPGAGMGVQYPEILWEVCRVLTQRLRTLGASVGARPAPRAPVPPKVAAQG